MIFEKALLLDTCALIWLVNGSDEISKETLKMIEDSPLVYISAISAWEISLKEAKGQLEFPMNSQEWFHKAVQHHDLTIAPLDVEILFKANKLPFNHKDPADRFIIATSQKLNAGIITADKLYDNYDVRIYI